MADTEKENNDHDYRIKIIKWYTIDSTVLTTTITTTTINNNDNNKTRPNNNQQQQKKRTCKIIDFTVSADHRIKLKKCEKKGKYLDFAKKIEKAVEHEGDDCTNCDWCFWLSNQRIIKGPGGLGSWWTRGDYPNDSVIENGQNIVKSPGD